MNNEAYAKFLWMLGVMIESAASAEIHPLKPEPLSEPETEQLLTSIRKHRQEAADARGEVSLTE